MGPSIHSTYCISMIKLYSPGGTFYEKRHLWRNMTSTSATHKTRTVQGFKSGHLGLYKSHQDKATSDKFRFDMSISLKCKHSCKESFHHKTVEVKLMIAGCGLWFVSHKSCWFSTSVLCMKMRLCSPFYLSAYFIYITTE